MDTNKIDSYYFEMFSYAGERECRKLVKQINSKVGGTKRITRDELLQFIQEGFKNIEKTHSEIFDTEPSYHITHLTNLICEEFGYSYEFNRYDVC